MNRDQMSLDDLNREQKRTLKRMGAISDTGAPQRSAPQARRTPQEQRTTPATYIREVRDEMRKVAWPRWPEVRKYAIIVLVAVVLYTAYVFGLDSLFGLLSGWLYD